MDKNKQREISSQGGKASQAGASARQSRGSGNQRSGAAKSTTGEKDVNTGIEMSQRDLNSLKDENEEVMGDVAYSETDEDEDEGLGDGNIGRSTRSRGSDEEG
jgi:hypothetical protein